MSAPLLPHRRGPALAVPLLLAGALLLLALPADAQWRWRDASGRVTASDMPPPREIPDKDILQRPASAARPATASTGAAPAASAPTSAPASANPAASGPASPVVDKELEARKRAADQQQQAQKKAEEQRNAATRADNCSRARNYLATLDSGQRVARMNDKGEREFLDDAARAAETRRAREIIASNCR